MSDAQIRKGRDKEILMKYVNNGGKITNERGQANKTRQIGNGRRK